MISNKPDKQPKVTKHKSKKVPSKKSWVWNWFAEVNLPNGKKVSECQVLVIQLRRLAKNVMQQMAPQEI